MNGGTCINLEPRRRYRCICSDGYWGENCEVLQEEQTNNKIYYSSLAAIVVITVLLIVSGKYEIAKLFIFPILLASPAALLRMKPL